MNNPFRLLSFLCLLFFSASVWADPAFVYEDHARRDPFWPLVSPGGVIYNYDTDFVIGDLILEGITLGAGEENWAIINGRVMKVHEQIGQFVIEEIKADRVILSKDAQRSELRLK